MGGVFWKWTIIVCGWSTVLEHWITSTSFFSWYVSYTKLVLNLLSACLCCVLEWHDKQYLCKLCWVYDLYLCYCIAVLHLSWDNSCHIIIIEIFYGIFYRWRDSWNTGNHCSQFYHIRLVFRKFFWFVFCKVSSVSFSYSWFPPFILLSVLNLAFALSVLGFMIMHLSLVASNTTTIEVMDFIYLFLFKLTSSYSIISHMSFLVASGLWEENHS